jgi:hypothetical protein
MGGRIVTGRDFIITSADNNIVFYHHTTEGAAFILADSLAGKADSLGHKLLFSGHFISGMVFIYVR